MIPDTHTRASVREGVGGPPFEYNRGTLATCTVERAAARFRRRTLHRRDKSTKVHVPGMKGAEAHLGRVESRDVIRRRGRKDLAEAACDVSRSCSHEDYKQRDSAADKTRIEPPATLLLIHDSRSDFRSNRSMPSPLSLRYIYDVYI